MKRDKIQNEYMFDTKVENVFINEYMISAPGNFVKVYLVALMYADLGKDIDNEKLAKTLAIERDEVERAWKYWKDLGLIKYEKEELIFVNLKEGIYGRKKTKEKNKEKQEEKRKQDKLHILVNSEIKNLFKNIEKTLARPLSGSETDNILSWIDDIGASPEIIAFAFSYCYSRKKENIRYIGRVVEGWTGRGFRTVHQVEEFLSETDQRHYMYGRIMKALGFHRNPTEEEKRIMDVWFDEMSLSMDTILSACRKTSGISNPNFNYVNSVLMGQRKDKERKRTDDDTGISRRHVMDYYEYIKKKVEDEARDRKDEIMSGIPRIAEIDSQLDENYIQMTRLAVSGGADKQQKIARLKHINEELRKEMTAILLKNRIPADYMDVHYRCPLCKDTGTLEDGQQCSCYVQRAKEAEEWRK